MRGGSARPTCPAPCARNRSRQGRSLAGFPFFPPNTRPRSLRPMGPLHLVAIVRQLGRGSSILAARLDVLEGLSAHREAVILIGAQAVYLRTGDSGLPVAPYTTDADLALDPEFLLDDPGLEPVMRAAGFEPDPVEVGRWTQVPGGGVVDLMVPEGVGGPGRR